MNVTSPAGNMQEGLGGVRAARIISVVAAVLIALACGTNVSIYDPKCSFS